MQEEDKQTLMRNKYKLGNNSDEVIYLNEDMTKQEKEKAKQIRIMAKQEREKGKSVKIRYSGLIIDGKEFRWNQSLEKLEPKN